MEQTYRCYWEEDGKLCRMDVDYVEDSDEAIDAVKSVLSFAGNHKAVVLAVVK